MKLAARFIALPVALLLASCHPTPSSQPGLQPSSQPVPDDANARAVLGFLGAYGRRDLEGMMKCLDEEATFRGSGAALSKPQIRDFFQATFRKHPNLRVEVGSLKVVGAAIHASVKVETNVIWSDTWIFELRNHKIHSYSLASGRR